MKKIILVSILSVAFLCSCARDNTIIEESPLPSSAINTPAVSAQSVEENTDEAEFNTISAQEAQEMMGEENVLLLDVRTQEEYQEGYIPGAVLIPHDEIEQKLNLLPEDLETTILVYCRTGRRSLLAAQELANKGYFNVYEFGGIITDWTGEVIKP